MAVAFVQPRKNSQSTFSIGGLGHQPKASLGIVDRQ
jgi:hypothetical protein